MEIKRVLSFLLITCVCLNLILASPNKEKLNSDFSKRDLLDDLIENFRNLDGSHDDNNSDSSVNPASVTVCPMQVDCVTCNNFSEDRVNCEWTNGKCQAQMKYDPSINWYKYLENCPKNDMSTKSKMEKYCGSVGQTVAFNVGNFTMPKVSNRYSSSNLYCKWTFSGIELNEYLLLEYYKKDYRHAFSIEGELYDGTPFSYNLSRNNFLFNALGVKYFSLHFFSYQDFDLPPFLIEMSYKKVTRSAMSIFLSVGLIVILIMLFSIIVYRCYMGLKMRRQLRRESDQHQREINYIIANNPEIMVNFDQNVDAELALKNKNKQEIEKLLHTDLKPNLYKEKMNEFNSTCTICMEGFAEDKSEVTVLYCKHIFHHNCLKNWLFKNLTHPKCPNCNFNVVDRSTNNLPNNVNYPTFTNNNNVSQLNDNTYNNLNHVTPNTLNVNIQQNSTRRTNNNNSSSNNRFISVSNNRNL